MKRIITIIFILLQSCHGAYSQYIPYADSLHQSRYWSLADKVNKSDVVVEGIIISETRNDGFRGPKGSIFTSNIIRVSKIFKGEITDTIIELITEGGTIPDGQFKGAETGSDGSFIGKGEDGLFFLRNDNTNIQSGKKLQSYFFLYWRSFIYYTGTRGSGFHSAYFDGKNNTDLESTLYKPIEAITATPRKVIGLLPFEMYDKNKK